MGGSASTWAIKEFTLRAECVLSFCVRLLEPVFTLKRHGSAAARNHSKARRAEDLTQTTGFRDRSEEQRTGVADTEDISWLS
jgi:hypothetical protein